MGRSPLFGGRRPPEHAPGTGTDALGPSDTSDSGSDVVGAAADLHDAGIDSDSDHGGTGERAEAGRETLRRDAPDIGADHVEDHEAEAGDAIDADLLADETDLEAQADEDTDARGESPTRAEDKGRQRARRARPR